jgi:hypothetical protein
MEEITVSISHLSTLLVFLCCLCLLELDDLHAVSLFIAH